MSLILFFVTDIAFCPAILIIVATWGNNKGGVIRATKLLQLATKSGFNAC